MVRLAMRSQPTVRTVFEDVDPDPDAILESFDVDSPDDLLAAAEDGPGEHDPTTDETLDADDATASDLFDDLEAAERALESTPEPADSDADPVDGGEIVLSEPTVVVEEDGWTDLEEAFAPVADDDRARDADDSPADEPKLVGPDPTPVRISDDAFGAAGRNRSRASDGDDAFESVWTESDGVRSGS